MEDNLGKSIVSNLVRFGYEGNIHAWGHEEGGLGGVPLPGMTSLTEH